jgi:hypothetical protein
MLEHAMEQRHADEGRLLALSKALNQQFGYVADRRMPVCGATIHRCEDRCEVRVHVRNPAYGLVHPSPPFEQAAIVRVSARADSGGRLRLELLSEGALTSVVLRDAMADAVGHLVAHSDNRLRHLDIRQRELELT